MIDFTFDGGSVPKVKKPSRRTKKRESPKKSILKGLLKTEYGIEEVTIRNTLYLMHYYVCQCGYRTAGSLNKLGALRTMESHQRVGKHNEV